MPPRSWSDKRERQYEHIKEGLEQRGEARGASPRRSRHATVNKERAPAPARRSTSEARVTASRSSRPDDELGRHRRGGLPLPSPPMRHTNAGSAKVQHHDVRKRARPSPA